MDTPTLFAAKLSLNNLQLKANLGVSEAERDTPQDVQIDFTFYYKDLPETCDTDELSDGSVCYHHITKLISKHCDGWEFKTLEYMCISIYQLLRSEIDDSIRIRLRVTKSKPPIEEVLGGTAFEYNDLYENM